MVIFPKSKINLGLNVVRRRPDGYHDLQTIMVPIGWTDVLEVVPSQSAATKLIVSGRKVNCPPEKNLVMKAYRAVTDEVGRIPPVDVYLRKVVPDGAGLGGGSADAAAMVMALDSIFCLNIGMAKLTEICSRIGADCPFFLHTSPMLATGTGTSLTEVKLPALEGLNIIVAKPFESVTTAEAYRGVEPSGMEIDLEQLAQLPPSEWRNTIFNSFEASIFPAHPKIEALKNYFYSCGAVYSAMSGSGSAVFGLFEGDILADPYAPALDNCDRWCGQL